MRGEAVFVHAAQTVDVSRENGRIYDEGASGPTHYNYFRDYDPATGRYIQSDPIGLAGGVNTYLYGDANPISKIDPLGLFGCPGGMRQEYRGPGNVVCVPDQNAPSPAVCTTAECAAGVLPVKKDWPSACERECGMGSDDALGRGIMCKVAAEGAKLFGSFGIPVTLACKAIDKQMCLKKCKEKENMCSQ